MVLAVIRRVIEALFMTRHGTKLIVTSPYPITVDRNGISLRCPKCRMKKPLMSSFGIRKMADKTLRNQPDCSDCRRMASKKSRQRKLRAVDSASVGVAAGLH